MTIRQKLFIHNLMNKIKRYIEACHTCLKTKPKYMKNQPVYSRIPVDYAPMQDYHSKRLMKSAKNFGITELELTGLLVNIHGFMQLLHNRYFEVLVDHKAIEYMIKSKTESPMMRLKTLLLKLSEYTIGLKYQKGLEMHTSNALSRLHNFTDTPDQKDVIPLNFLQHLTPHYIQHSYSHLVENLYAHKTKTLDATRVKRKCGRPPKPKPQIPSSKPRTSTAAKNLTTQL